MMPVNAENQVLDDQVDAPLDRAEILRLVKASRNAGYHPAADSFTNLNPDFRPLSIKDMAILNAKAAAEKAQAEAQAKSQADAEVQAEMEKNSPSETSSPNEELPKDNPATAEDTPGIEAAEKPSEEGNAHEANTEIEDDQKAAAEPEPHPADSDESINSPEEASSENNIETLGEKVKMAAESSDNSTTEDPASFDEIKAKMDAVSRLKPAPEGNTEGPEYQRGYEEGRKAVLAEKEAELNEAIAAFTSATQALGNDENIDLSQLSPAISKAIMELASERAGLAIEEHPDAFTARIETMVKRIRNRVDEPYIRLHPEDAKIIGEKLEESLSPRVIHIVADENLKRGDARIDVGSIGVMDLISSRMADADASSANKGEAEND